MAKKKQKKKAPPLVQSKKTVKAPEAEPEAVKDYLDMIAPAAVRFKS